MIIKMYFTPDDFHIELNLGETAGAGLADHLLLYIIPRWHSDHNCMTTVAAIRTTPEHIYQTYASFPDDFQTMATPKRVGS